MAWATKPTGSTPVWWARRLAMVRGFARYLKAIDPDTEIPPLGVLPYRFRRVDPYLYSDADIEALMAAARALPSPQRAATYETLIGLIAVTGMRLGEAVRLDRDDVDWDEGVITIWNSKFAGAEPCPCIPPAWTLCADTPRSATGSARTPRRRHSSSRPSAPGSTTTTSTTFRRLVRDIGLDSPAERRPRLHDLRHRFAVQDAHQLVSRRGGRRSPHAAAVHLSGPRRHRRTRSGICPAVPELLFLASERLERKGRGRS